jgi:hypothetical protein
MEGLLQSNPYTWSLGWSRGVLRTSIATAIKRNAVVAKLEMRPLLCRKTVILHEIKACVAAQLHSLRATCSAAPRISITPSRAEKTRQAQYTRTTSAAKNETTTTDCEMDKISLATSSKACG